jgi:hypothetical protein
MIVAADAYLAGERPPAPLCSQLDKLPVLCYNVIQIPIQGGAMIDRRRKTVTIRFAEAEIAAIQKAAQAEGRTTSQYVRWVVLQAAGVGHEKQSNPQG